VSVADSEPTKSAYERLLEAPGQLKAEVVVNHRVGYGWPDDVEDMTAGDVAKADAMLEVYVQMRIRAAR